MSDISEIVNLAPPRSHEWSVLCVDDEPNILAALRRQLRGTGYQVLTAESGEQALAVLRSQPVDLVLSDMRMPGMDGAALLEQVRERYPETVRLLLTGYADLGSTVAAINRGGVYRYITKPWNEGEILVTIEQAFERLALTRDKRRLEALTEQQNKELLALNASLEQRVQARTQELAEASDKLRKSFLSSIKSFSSLLELRGGGLVGHSRRVADLARRTAKAMNWSSDELQQVFVAALLHDIGQIGLPDSILAEPVPSLSEADMVHYRRHAAMGEQALLAIDELQPAAALIRSHHERYEGGGFPDGLAGDAIPKGARILAVVDAYDDLQTGAMGAKLNAEQARTLILRGRGTQFDPEVVDVFLQVAIEATPAAMRAPLRVSSLDLRPGMRLACELLSKDRVVLLASGHVLTDDLIERIKRLEQRDGVRLDLTIHPT